MGGFASIVRGALAGLNTAAGNTQTASELEAANERARQDKIAKLRSQVAPHAIAIQGLQTRLQGIDPNKDPQQYAALTNEIQQNLAAVRGILYPEQNPRGNIFERAITDPMHITSQQGREQKEAGRRAQGVAQDEASAQAIARGSVPYMETPQHKEALDMLQRQTDAQVRVAEARLQGAGWTKNGNPVQVDGQWMQPFTNKMGETMMSAMPPGYMGPNTKPMKGTLVKSAQSPTGFAQTYVDPMNPGKVVAWQPVTPSRYYQGTTTSSSTTDPFGVTSTTSRTTEPISGGMVDLSGAVALPSQESQAATPPTASPTPAPSTTPPAGHKTRQLHQVRAAQTGGAKQLDSSGHIPTNAGNPQLVQAANSLIDGMDVDKLPLPQRDRPAAMALAREYGWQGQGTFTPKESVLLKEAGTFIQEAAGNPSLAVLDNPQSRARLSVLIGNTNRGGTLNNILQIAASQGASPEEMEFLRMYNQLVGTISGLGQLTRSGRMTEAGIHRLMQELPNPVNTNSAQDAKQRLQRLQNELNVAIGPQGQAPKSDIDEIVKALSGKK